MNRLQPRLEEIPAAAAQPAAASAHRAILAPSSPHQIDVFAGSRAETANNGRSMPTTVALGEYDYVPGAATGRRGRAALQRGLAHVLRQERDLICVGNEGLVRTSRPIYAARARYAERLAENADEPERARLRRCGDALAALSRHIAALPLAADGSCAQEPATVTIEMIGAAFAPAIAALEALDEARRAAMIGASALYPEHPASISDLAVLARLQSELGGCDGTVARVFLAECERIGNSAQRDLRGGDGRDKARQAWNDLQRVSAAMRQTSLVETFEEATATQDVADLETLISAIVDDDRKAWATAYFYMKAIFERYVRFRDTTCRALGYAESRQVQANLDAQLAGVRGLQAASRDSVKRRTFVSLWLRARNIQAEQNQVNGVITTFVALPIDVVVILGKVKDVLDSLGRPSHKKHAAKRERFYEEMDEQSHFAMAMYDDSIADDTLQSFVRINVDNLITAALNRDEAIALLKKVVTFRDAIVASPRQAPGPTPCAGESEQRASQTETSATAAREPMGQRDDGLEEAPPVARQPAPARAFPFARDFRRWGTDLQARRPHHANLGWRKVLRKFAPEDYALADVSFAQASFGSPSEAAAYHYYKHRRPQQTFGSYVREAVHATKQFVGLLVPSLHNPGQRLCAIDDDTAYCVFTRDAPKRIITYRNRAALGR